MAQLGGNLVGTAVYRAAMATEGYPLVQRRDGYCQQAAPTHCPNGHELKPPNVLVGYSSSPKAIKAMLNWQCQTLRRDYVEGRVGATRTTRHVALAVQSRCSVGLHVWPGLVRPGSKRFVVHLLWEEPQGSEQVEVHVCAVRGDLFGVKDVVFERR